MKYEHQISPTPKIIGAIAATKFQNDTPQSSLMDSIVTLKVKISKGKGVGVRSLVRNTLRV
jgi:hypothetical protein